jgi:CRP/FNR family transcriptional regulator
MAINPTGEGLTRTAGGDHSLLSFPRQDALFAAVVEAQIDEVHARGTMRAARRQLRLRYPDADLHRQHQVLIHGVATEVWFAYRNGRGSSSRPVDRWWDAPDMARAVVDSAGRLGDINAACRVLLGVPGGKRFPATIGTFASAEFCNEIAKLASWLASAGEVTSSAALRTPWGRRMDVEFHAVWNGAGPGRHSLALRSFAQRDEANDHQAIGASGLAALSPGVRDGLLRGATRRELPAGARLQESLVGEPWIILVVAGVVRLYLAEGMEPTAVYGRHGSVLGTQWLLPSDSVAMGLQAVTPSVLLQFSPARVAELVESSPEFARALLGQGQILAHDLVMSFASLASASLPQRLAREILLLSELQPNESLLPVTEQQLADGVGSIRESIGRTIAEFRRQSWLATTRHGVIVLDAAALRRLAQLDLA